MMDYTKAYAGKSQKGFDEGLRSYMLKIYNYMALALLLTGAMAYGSLNFPPLMSLMYSLGPNGEILGQTTLRNDHYLCPSWNSSILFHGYGKNVCANRTSYLLGLCRTYGNVPIIPWSYVYWPIISSYFLNLLCSIWFYELIWIYN